MALLDRIFRDNVNPSVPRISGHLMAAGFWMLAKGDINQATLKTALEFDALDDPQFAELVAYYAALSADEKKDFFGDWTAWTIAAAHQKVTRAQFAAKFNLTE